MFKKALAVGLATLVLVGMSVPGHSANEVSNHQFTLAGFASTATKLSTKQRTELSAAAKRIPKLQSALCTGITSTNAGSSEKARAVTRAKATCAALKQTMPTITVSHNSKPSTAASYRGKVIVSFQSESVLVANPALVSPSQCKILENNQYRKPSDAIQNFTGLASIQGLYSGNATAFPFNPTVLPIKGSIDVAFIYVEWDDLRGTTSDYNYYQKQINMFKDLYWMVSENKLDMRIQSSKTWFRIPGSYKQHTLTFEQEAQSGYAPRKQAFYDAAVAASDPETNFKDIEIVFFAIPRAKSVFFHGGPHEFNWIHNGYLNTKERKIYDIAAAGDWFLKNDTFEPPWVYYVHEVGHMIGIPHQANEEVKDGRIKELSNPINGYEIMANQGGATRTMSSWLRWLAGWLEDEQVACATKDSITDNYFELHPINRVKGEVESLVIRLNDKKAVVVESRRFDEYFDRRTKNSKDGLIVYTVDASKGSAQGNQALLSPRDIKKYISEPTWRDGYELDAFFFQGDKVTIDGLTIEAHLIGQSSDIVRVYKAR